MQIYHVVFLRKKDERGGKFASKQNTELLNLSERLTDLIAKLNLSNF